MRCLIIDISTNTTIGIYKVSVGVIGKEANLQQYEAECWSSAVEDGLVDAQSRKLYRIEILPNE
jgi:hypothetical protein